LINKIKSIFLVYDLTKSFLLDQKGLHNDVIKRLNKHYKWLENSKYKYLFYDYYILLAEQYFRINNIKKAYELFDIALYIIEKADYLNEDEKEYLTLYISYFRNLKNSRKIEFNSNNISNTIKIKFPNPW